MPSSFGGFFVCSGTMSVTARANYAVLHMDESREYFKNGTPLIPMEVVHGLKKHFRRPLALECLSP